MQAEFVRATRGRQYGLDALSRAWEFFREGWNRHYQAQRTFWDANETDGVRALPGTLAWFGCILRKNRWWRGKGKMNDETNTTPPEERMMPWVFLSVRERRRFGYGPLLMYAVQTSSELVAQSVMGRVLADPGMRQRDAGEVDGVRWMTAEAWEDRAKAPHPFHASIDQAGRGTQ